jgi:NAD(P)-dependent dehydrogenase (short-subunit alcohol dehydrogenase family)
MTWNFQNEVVYVSAGAWGIGRAVVNVFAGAGARVFFGDINEFHGRELEEMWRTRGADVCFVKADFAEEDAWSKMVSVGGLEPTIMVSNAGIAGNMPIDVLDVERYDLVHAVNQRSALLGIKCVVPFMRKRGSGSIVLLGSIMSQTFFPGSSAYVATKAALEGLTKSLAVELGGDGIRVNCVQPGFTRVGMAEELRGNVPPQLWTAFAEHFESYLMENHAKMQPLCRGTDSKDVANAIAFLCSDLAGCITGSVIPIDGGLSLPVASDKKSRLFMTEWTPEMDEWVKERLSVEKDDSAKSESLAVA